MLNNDPSLALSCLEESRSQLVDHDRMKIRWGDKVEGDPNEQLNSQLHLSCYSISLSSLYLIQSFSFIPLLSLILIFSLFSHTPLSFVSFTPFHSIYTLRTSSILFRNSSSSFASSPSSVSTLYHATTFITTPFFLLLILLPPFHLDTTPMSIPVDHSFNRHILHFLSIFPLLVQ